ncbi:MAG: zf-TFIIB domain-containing protein [Candidatus Omnitrophica bacterium]|nr:zf-TFIIB domain-containing protein [Candidatus Omnitrophota bacterium]
MRCPFCESATLITKEIIPHLQAQECSQCHGHWIASTAYQEYLMKKDGGLEPVAFEDVIHQTEDSKKGMICPDCGHILVKFRIGQGIDFYLDHCLHCNGVWLDSNEWNTLYHHQLHDDLNKVFTTSWQNKIKKEAHRAAIEKIYRAKFGARYAALCELKEWMSQENNRSLVLAFLENHSGSND